MLKKPGASFLNLHTNPFQIVIYLEQKLQQCFSCTDKLLYSDTLGFFLKEEQLDNA